MIGDNVRFEELPRVIEGVDAVEELLDHELLVVSGDEEREASSGTALIGCPRSAAKTGDGQEKEVKRQRGGREHGARK
jgi:hypothetical protein